MGTMARHDHSGHQRHFRGHFPNTNAEVLRWLAAQPMDDVWTTAITAAELRAGAAVLPDGRRKLALRVAIEAMLMQDCGGRILPFDDAASVSYAEISARRRRLGRPIGPLDMQIAAIAAARGAAVATRNTPHFEEGGIELIDPWAA